MNEIHQFSLFILKLSQFFSHLQNALPANGAPVSRQRTGRVRELYQDYVLQRTIGNWKFWIVSREQFRLRSQAHESLFSSASFSSRFLTVTTQPSRQQAWTSCVAHRCCGLTTAAPSWRFDQVRYHAFIHDQMSKASISAVSNKLREISTTTDILSDNPTSLQDEVLKAVKNVRSRSHESPR